MDKNISQSTPARPTAPSQNQGAKKAPSPASLLKMVTGAGAKATQVAQDAQATAQKLSSALKPSAGSASELTPPELPETQEKRGFFQKVAGAVEEARTTAIQSRRELLAKAGETTPSGAKFVADDDVATLYQAGKSKLGTDEKRIRELLWDRSPEQLEAVAAVYKDHHNGRDLWKDLDREFEDPNDKKMVAALRKGDRATAAAAALVDATTGQTSKTRVREVMSRLSPEEGSKAQELYREFHPRGQELSDWTDRKFKGERKNQIDALLQGDSQKAELAGFRHSLGKGKGAEVVAHLRRMKPEDRQDFIRRFDESAGEGQGLSAEVGRLKGTNRDQAQALLAGNEAAADAALIQDALDGMGSNKRKLWDGLGSDIQDPQKRRAYQQSVVGEFNRMYGPESARGGQPLDKRLRSELGGENQEKALTLMKEGELPPEKRLKFALGGSKKNGMELASLIEQHGPEKARRMYSEATKSGRHPDGRDLETDIQKRLGGRGRYEAKVAMKGPAETPQEKVARTVDRTRFETTGGGGAFTNSDEILKTNTRRAQDALKQLERARASGDENGVAEWTTRIDELTGYAKTDVKVFRGEKDGAVELTAGVAAGVAAAGAIAVTGGAAAPLVAMAAGAATNYGTRNLMAGNSYDQNDAAKDILVGAMEGVGVKGGAIMGRAAKGAVQSRVRNTSAAKLGGNVAEGTADGLTGGALMGATETALADGTWENGAASGMGKVLSGAATGGAVGSAFGGSMGAGLTVAGDLAGESLSKSREWLSQRMGRSKPADINSPEMEKALTAARDANPAPTPEQALAHKAAWESGQYQQSKAYTALNEAQRADFDYLASSIKEIDVREGSTGAALVGLLESGRALKKGPEGKTVLGRLRSLKENPRLEEVGPEADELFQSTLRMVHNPGVIHQGQRGTCAATSVQFLHAASDPADFVRVMDELTSKGVAKTKGDFDFKLNKTAFQKHGFDSKTGTRTELPVSRQEHGDELFEELNRGPVSRIYQSTAMNSVGDVTRSGLVGEYDNFMMTVTRKVNGRNETREITPEVMSSYSVQELNNAVFERGGFRYSDGKGSKVIADSDPAAPGNIVTDGLSPQQQQTLLERMLGKKVYRRDFSVDGRFAALGGKASKEALSPRDRRVFQMLMLGTLKAGDEGRPMTIGVDWGGGGHAVAIAGFTKDGRFLIKNPQAAGRDVYDPKSGSLPRDSSPEAVGAELSAAGYSAVNVEDLIPRLKSLRVSGS